MPYPAKISTASILAAATQIIEHQGVEALGMRAVAKQLAVRPASLYKHVQSLDALHALLAEQAAERLLARMNSALAKELDDSDPTSAVRLMAREYVGFARAHSAQYAVLSQDGSGSPDSIPAHPYQARKALWNALLSGVASLTGNADDTGAAVALWAFLHGFVVLERAGLYGPSGPQDGLERGLDALAIGLRRTNTPTSA